jgi:hypothetical protein
MRAGACDEALDTVTKGQIRKLPNEPEQGDGFPNRDASPQLEIEHEPKNRFIAAAVALSATGCRASATRTRVSEKRLALPGGSHLQDVREINPALLAARGQAAAAVEAAGPLTLANCPRSRRLT